MALHDKPILICDVAGISGAITHDASKPDGVARRRLDGTRLAALGWRAKIPLREGLAETYRWYAANFRG